jgi:carboxyl-terminal processing protease
VAACLQDSSTNGVVRAVVVGEQTFGKGSVQKIIPFPSGDALRLTTAKYYSPNHRVIHMRGVTPDVVVPMSDEQEEALFYRARGGTDTAPEGRRDQLAEAQDVQFDRAVEVLKGLNVFAQRAPKNETLRAARPADSVTR